MQGVCSKTKCPDSYRLIKTGAFRRNFMHSTKLYRETHKYHGLRHLGKKLEEFGGNIYISWAEEMDFVDYGNRESTRRVMANSSNRSLKIRFLRSA